MAKPCTINYTSPDGTEYQNLTEEEFFALLASGEFEKLVNEGFLPPIVDGDKNVKEPNKNNMRSFTKRILEDPTVPQEVKDAFTEDDIYYERMPNKVSVETANAIVDAMGGELALQAVLDETNGMPQAVRSTLAQVIIRKAEDVSPENAVELIGRATSYIAKKGTEYGQFIQTLSLIPFLSKEGQLVYAQKNIETINKAKAKKAEKDIKAKKKALKEVNKKVINQVLEGESKAAKEVEKKASVQEEKGDDEPSYGTKNKVVTKKRYNEIKKNLKGKLFSSAINPELVELAAYHIEAGSREFATFSKKMLRDLGSGARKYLKELYEKGNKELGEKPASSDKEIDAELIALQNAEWEKASKGIEKRLDAAIKSKNKRKAKQALAELQNLSKELGLWGKYRDYAAKMLKTFTVQTISEDAAKTPPLNEFVDGLVKNMRAKMQEALPEKQKQERKVKPSVEILADAIKNKEKYAEVWEQTQKEIQERFKDEPEKLAALDNYFGELMETPFSKKMVTSAVREGLKNLGSDIKEIIKKHYTVYDYTKRSLAQKLIEEAGLSGDEALELAEAVQMEFDRLAQVEKEKALEKLRTGGQKLPQNRKKTKTLEEELIELSNLGAFNDEEFLNKYAEANGWPKLTQEDISEISRLSDIVENMPEGLRRARAVENLLSYQANLKGVSKRELADAIWYASILSGQKTQLRNLTANIFSTILGLGVDIARSPKSAPTVLSQVARGIKRGLIEGQEVIRTGYSPIRGKIEVPATLERVKFDKIKLLNAYKYVRRIMFAVDTVFYEIGKEGKAAQIAYEIAANRDSSPEYNAYKEAKNILGLTEENIADAMEEARLEAEAYIEDIQNDDTLTEKQKQDAIAQERRDQKRRVYEILEQNRIAEFQQQMVKDGMSETEASQRASELLEETESFGRLITYNYKPTGTFGIMAGLINQMHEKLGVTKYFIPFTNIIMNVASDQANYTPLGYMRSLRGGSLLRGTDEKLTERQQRELIVSQRIKATIGTSLMVALYLLSQKGDDDDEPMVEITANGYNHYAKNEKLRKTGWQPYSIKIGKKWYSYELTPLKYALAFVGAVRDAEEYRDVKNTDDLFTKFRIGATWATRTFLDGTIVSGLNTLINLIANPQDEDVTDRGIKEISKMGTSLFVPNFWNQNYDYYKEMMNTPEKEIANNYGAYILKNIPVANDKFFQDKVNVLGEYVVKDNDMLISAQRKEPVWQLLVDNNIAATKISYNKAVNDDNKQIIVDKETLETRPMTAEEYHDFSRIRGAVLKKYLEHNLSDLQAMPSGDVKKAYSQISGIASDWAMGVVQEQALEGKKLDVSKDAVLDKLVDDLYSKNKQKVSNTSRRSYLDYRPKEKKDMKEKYKKEVNF